MNCFVHTCVLMEPCNALFCCEYSWTTLLASSGSISNVADYIKSTSFNINGSSMDLDKLVNCKTSFFYICLSSGTGGFQWNILRPNWHLTNNTTIIEAKCKCRRSCYAKSLGTNTSYSHTQWAPVENFVAEFINSKFYSPKPFMII